VSNQGNPGEAASAPATLTRFSSAIVGHKVVLMMEGSNDLYLAYSSGSSVTDTALVNLRTMVLRARTAGLMPLIATVPPMNPTACTPICRGFAAALVPAFNDRIRALASGEGVTLVDVNKAFNGDFSLLSDDGLHPNAQGYATIANTFFDAIRTTLE
jgi:lysophospholipase L1-like esterase